MAIIKGVPKIEGVFTELNKIPDKAGECSKKAPEEFADLEFLEKAKMIKNVALKISKIKDSVQKMKDEMTGLKDDMLVIKDGS